MPEDFVMSSRSHSFFIQGSLPGLNEIIAAAKQHNGTWNAYADLKRMWSEIVMTTAMRAHLKPIVGPISLHFQWREPNRRRDPDNIAAGKKFIIDGLVAAGIIGGDGWKQITGWTDTFRVDPNHPGVMTEILESAIENHEIG